MTYYPLTHQEWLRAIELSPAQKDIYLYLKTLNPFPGREIKISVDRLVADLKMHRDTILRHLRKLKEKGWLTYQINSLTIRLNSQPEEQPEEEQPEEEQIQATEERSNDRPERSNDLSEKNENPDISTVSADPAVTNNRGLKTLNQTLVKTENEQGGFGQILEAIEKVGIRANYTIQKTIHRLKREFGPAAAARRVELAIEALQEQQQKCLIRNPGGWLNAALLRCFTPNDDGYRERSSAAPTAPAAPVPVPAVPTAPAPAPVPVPAAPAPVPAPLPDADQLERTCDQLLLQGKRERVLTRLRELISEGYTAEVRSLLALRRDWKFKLKGGTQVVDIS
jgi:hypothetical protein